MSQLLVRNLEVSTVNALKKLAEQHNRSLQAEVKLILEAAGRYGAHDPAKLAAKIRMKLSAKPHTDSAKLIARDRNR
jgi:plasmid stability protein